MEILSNITVLWAQAHRRSHCGNGDLFTSALNLNLTFRFGSVWFQSQLQKGDPCYKIATHTFFLFFFFFSVIAFRQVLYFERRVKRITTIQILPEFFSTNIRCFSASMIEVPGQKLLDCTSGWANLALGQIVKSVTHWKPFCAKSIHEFWKNCASWANFTGDKKNYSYIEYSCCRVHMYTISGCREPCYSRTLVGCD